MTSTGAGPLKDITIVDDAGTNATGDDFKPVAILKAQWNSGDNDKDGLLDAGETWLYTSAGIYTTALSQGAYINVAQVTGTDTRLGTIVRDDDTANLVIALPAHTNGRMTGGGSIYTADDTRVTHGFELHCDSTIGPNNLEINWDKNKFHLEQVTAMSCYDDPALSPLPRPAPFDTLVGQGIGRFNGIAGYHVSFKFTDSGEPGTSDLAQIEIRDPQGALVLFVSGNLHNGNQQAHPENKASALLLADAAPDAPVAQGAEPTIAELSAMVAEARRAWVEAGIGAQQLAMLDTVQFDVADLPGRSLGRTIEGQITIDANAAGWNWFVDDTPRDSREFALQDGSLVATAGPAAGHMDLLTVVSHEMGHAMGLDHVAGGVMDEDLSPGQRVTPNQPPLPAASGADAGSDLFAAENVAAGASAAGPLSASPHTQIDWAVPLAVLNTAAGIEQQTDGASWQDRFVNHLGATPELLNPNASLRLHVSALPALAPRGQTR